MRCALGIGGFDGVCKMMCHDHRKAGLCVAFVQAPGAPLQTAIRGTIPDRARALPDWMRLMTVPTVLRTDDTDPPGGLDHLVLATGDLDRAAGLYAAMGFTLTPRALHPWGTANRLVQLQGSFLEVLEVAEPEKLVAHDGRHFSFGAYLDDYLTRREGCAMLVLESTDARSDRDRFAARGLPDLAPFDFERQATLPDGRSVRVAFSLAFAPLAEAPEAVFFTCQQHAPEHFWKPDYQVHANTAQTLEEVAMIAPDPSALKPSMAAMLGADALEESDGEVICETPRGRIRIMTADRYALWFGEGPAAQAPATPHFAGARIGVADLKAAAAQVEAAGLQADWARAGLVVPSARAHGTTIAFAQL